MLVDNPFAIISIFATSFKLNWWKKHGVISFSGFWRVNILYFIRVSPNFNPEYALGWLDTFPWNHYFQRNQPHRYLQQLPIGMRMNITPENPWIQTKKSDNKQIINIGVPTKPNSQYQTNTDTNRHKQTDTLYLHFWTTRKESKRKVCERAEKR